LRLFCYSIHLSLLNSMSIGSGYGASRSGFTLPHIFLHANLEQRADFLLLKKSKSIQPFCWIFLLQFQKLIVIFLCVLFLIIIQIFCSIYLILQYLWELIFALHLTIYLSKPLRTPVEKRLQSQFHLVNH